MAFVIDDEPGTGGWSVPLVGKVGLIETQTPTEFM